jgi:hypothetical protein
MNKRFLSTLMAGVAALSIAGTASAADQPQGTQQPPAAQPSDNTGSSGAQHDAAKDKDKDAYFAALSRCDELKRVAEQQQCVDTVRKQYGQM